MYTISLPTLESTQNLGLALGRSLTAGSTLLMAGDLGAGKTTLIQSLGLGLGIQDPIVSPTFTLINEYHEGRIPLYHLDLYRLQPEHVSGLYLENYMEGIDVPLGIVAIEWSERLPEMPESYLKIQLSYEGEGRRVQISSHGPQPLNLEFLESL